MSNPEGVGKPFGVPGGTVLLNPLRGEQIVGQSLMQ